MTTFFFDKTKIELPAVQISPPEGTTYRDAWLHEVHITIRLSAAVKGFRVHTNGVNLPTGAQFGKMVASRKEIRRHDTYSPRVAGGVISPGGPSAPNAWCAQTLPDHSSPSRLHPEPPRALLPQHLRDSPRK
jgi:hypothetical protein